MEINLGSLDSIRNFVEELKKKNLSLSILMEVCPIQMAISYFTVIKGSKGILQRLSLNILD
jgi:hypothetical protein